MEDRHQQIKQYLQDPIVQKRILENMQRANDEATVTISNAAHLFGFSENQLRDWDEKGLLKSQRRPQDAEQDGKGARRRQYTFAELNKLAVIHELLEQGNFSIGTIPTYVDEIWDEVASQTQQKSQLPEIERKDAKHVHIDQRIENTEKEEFWRYFVSQALRLSLLLICEDVPDSVAGIILPLREKNVAEIIRTPNDLNKSGYSLVGWLSQSRSFYTFLDTDPTFEHPSDFRVESWANLAEDLQAKQEPQNNVLIIVQRKAKQLVLSREAAKTIQILLGLVYNTADHWRPAFDNSLRDWMYQATNFTGSSAVSDEVLNGLANIIVQLGGKTEDGQGRWRFSCILLPRDSGLPVQQRSLVVRAQSKYAPHKVGTTTVYPSSHVDSLSIKAFQSGNIMYVPETLVEDSMIAYQEPEEPVGSAIAVPVEGEDGLSMAVIYVAANMKHSFTKEDQRALRIVGRMLQELILVHRIRSQMISKLTELIDQPNIVDVAFKEFLTEDDFIRDIEYFLIDMRGNPQVSQESQDEISFIAIDIDNHGGIATKYGDIMARNLSREVGLKIQENLDPFFTNAQFRRLYHVNADRYYLFLRGMALNEVQSKAEFLRQALAGNYFIDARRVSIGRALRPDDMISINDVTVRMGIHSYTYEKMIELLDRYKSEHETAVLQVRKLIMKSFNGVLDKGRRQKGNVIFTWDPQIWGYRPLHPGKAE